MRLVLVMRSMRTVSLVNIVCVVTITRCNPDSDDGGAGPTLFLVDDEGNSKAKKALEEAIKPNVAPPVPPVIAIEPAAPASKRVAAAATVPPREGDRVPVARREGARAATGLSLAQLFGR